MTTSGFLLLTFSRTPRGRFEPGNQEPGGKTQENPQPVLEEEIQVDPETFGGPPEENEDEIPNIKSGALKAFKAFCPSVSLNEHPHPILHPDIQPQKK